MSNTEESLPKPKCSDNRDNDGDGLKDFPNDPGCGSEINDDEIDDCPDGPFCPQCANGRDDDISGLADFPADLGCDSASDNFELVLNPVACGQNLTINQLPPSGIANGTLVTTSVSNLTNTCGGTNGMPAVAYVMVLSTPKVVRISTLGSSVDTIIDLRKAPCSDDASSLECNNNVSGTDNSSMITRSLAAGVYFILLEAAMVGDYVLKVEKFNGEGEMCNLPTDCGPGLVCRIPVGGTEKICTQPVCSDGLDDDGDGKIDYPFDPGCENLTDPDEVDDCPSGPNCPDCSDGVDNDNDTFTDYPMDPSCKAAGDSSEACTTSEPIGVITTGSTFGDTTGQVDDYDPICNSSVGFSPDLLYRIDLPTMSVLNLNIIGFDSVHTLLDSTCGGTPVRCSDPPLMTVNNLAAGTYYVTVEGWSQFTPPGPFTIQTSGTIAAGGRCENALFASGAITCETGFVCDGPVGQKKCTTACSDGIDNNGDGKTDYPSDPGCSAPNDNSEDTVCPGAMCPVCADTVDNDMDGQIDWPLDTSCPAAGGTSESCNTSEPIGQILGTTTTGTTIGAVNDFDPTCNSTTGLSPDVIYRIDLPAMSSLNLNVTGFDTVHTLLGSSCTSSLQCSDPSLMTTGALAAGTYFVSVEGWSTTSQGAFTITTSGTVAPGGSCEGQLFQAGAITCGTGFVCDGPVGARTCRTQCSDGIDNNGDGKIDYPFDPGCSAPNDNSETTVCPGAMCPICSDGLDNDNDTQIDYPVDTTCLAAGGSSESCVTSEPINIITTGITTGTTAGLTNDYKPICSNITNHTAPDQMLQLDIPAMQSLSLNLTPFDGAHSLLDSTCGAVPIACSDPSLMTVPNLPAGRYYVVVDGWSSGNGAYTLTTSGTIPAGGSCENALFTAGAISCPAGLSCQGPVGSKKCLSQCSDGIDNNLDGKIDFPFDPACTSLADNSENSVCPGVGCPACGNTADDDGDGTIDFPADVGCSSAAGTSEVFCNVEPNFAGVISQPQTSGTLGPPAANNYNQTCQTNTGADVAYGLSLPVPVQSLRIDTIGSQIADTVISLKDSTCSTQFGCDDDSDPAGNLSLLTVANLQPGSYAIQVDSYNVLGPNNGPFKLNVRGTVAAGTPCTSPLFTSGVLVCGNGSSCTAGTCQ